jgi:2-polyprenyl-3-methyl-5-hydroxy-6-metoxy-1,4-benzoquinol methylase
MATAVKAPKKVSRPTKIAHVSPQRITELTWDFARPLMVEAAIRNRVFDVLDRGPKSLDQIAKATGASSRGLRILLNGLVGLQLLETKGGKFSLPPDVAAFLVTTKPTFMGGLLMQVSRQIIPNWLHLAEIVRTGSPRKSINQSGPGSEFFAEFVENIFNMSFASASIAADELVAKATKATSVLDIAAGSGVWGIAMANKSRHVRVTAVDWAEVIEITRKVVGKHKLTGRFSFVAGDILSSDLGKNHQVATLGHILHSEGEDRSRELLKKVFEALAPGGTIVIGEFIPDKDRRSPAIPLIFAVNMLVNTDEGDTFTFDEIKSWLQDAGFRKVRKLEARGPSPLILADKP